MRVQWVRWGTPPPGIAGRLIKRSLMCRQQLRISVVTGRRRYRSFTIGNALVLSLQDELITLSNLVCKLETFGLNQTRRLIQSVAASVGCFCNRPVSAKKCFILERVCVCLCVSCANTFWSVFTRLGCVFYIWSFARTAQTQVRQPDSTQICWVKLIAEIWVSEQNKLTCFQHRCLSFRFGINHSSFVPWFYRSDAQLSRLWFDSRAHFFLSFRFSASAICRPRPPPTHTHKETQRRLPLFADREARGERDNHADSQAEEGPSRQKDEKQGEEGEQETLQSRGDPVLHSRMLWNPKHEAVPQHKLSMAPQILPGLCSRAGYARGSRGSFRARQTRTSVILLFFFFLRTELFLRNVQTFHLKKKKKKKTSMGDTETAPYKLLPPGLLGGT